MKKTLLVLATLAATAGFAQAATVNLYGAVDLGLSYKYSKVDGEKATHQYGLESGNLGASKFGLKGEEELGNGYVVGFKLENGFSADDGTLGQSGRLFGREARLYVKGGFGELSAGRMGALSSGAGTYDIFQAYGDAFDGGVADIGAGYWHETGRYDNTLTYATPEFAGFKVYAQYSFATDGQETGHERDKDRYMGIGATYDNGPLGLVFVVDSVKYGDYKVNDDLTYRADDDSITFSVGGSYDFGSVKPYIGAQYGKHMSAFAGFGAGHDDFIIADLKGYAVSVGGIFQVPCGTVQAGLFYAQAKGDAVTGAQFDEEAGDYQALGVGDAKSTIYGIGLVHSYPISKRTTFYSGVGFTYQKLTGQSIEYVDDAFKEGSVDDKRKSAQVLFGLNHTF